MFMSKSLTIQEMLIIIISVILIIALVNCYPKTLTQIMHKKHIHTIFK